MTKKVCNEKIPRRSRDFAEESSRKCRERAVSREPWANIFEIFYFVSEPWASELRILQISTLVSERERAGSKIPWAWASKLAPLARSRLAHGSRSHYLEHWAQGLGSPGKLPNPWLAWKNGYFPATQGSLDRVVIVFDETYTGVISATGLISSTGSTTVFFYNKTVWIQQIISRLIFFSPMLEFLGEQK